jgi:hypothetical protein
MKKLVLTTTALVALAVGGAAFAQAQSAGTVAKVSVQQSQAETTMPGDADNVQSGDQGGFDRGSQTDDQGSDSQSEAPESASENDAPGGHQDENGTAHESETND